MNYVLLQECTKKIELLKRKSYLLSLEVDGDLQAGDVEGYYKKLDEIHRLENEILREQQKPMEE